MFAGLNAHNEFYDVRPGANIFTRIGNKFLESIDLSNNLYRVTLGMKGIKNGWISLVMLVAAFAAMLGFGALAFLFDLHSTYNFTKPTADRIEAIITELAVAGFVGFVLRWVPTSLTVLPTVMEFLGSRFARFNIPAVQALTWAFIGLDMVTDIPMVNETVNPLWSACVAGSDATGFFGILFTFNPRIILGAVGFYAVWVLFLLAASYFFELVTVLMAWCVIGLFFKSVGYFAWKGGVLLFGLTGWRFSGDLGGASDANFKGDAFHAQEAHEYGFMGNPRKPRAGGSGRSGRAAPRRAAPREDPDAWRMGAVPMDEGDEFGFGFEDGDGDLGPDLDELFGADFAPRGPRPGRAAPRRGARVA